MTDNHRSIFMRYSLCVPCLCIVYFIQTAHAGAVSLGGPFSIFDDLYITATGADQSQNCANLTAAISAITGVGTVRLPPATYDCGTTTLDVPVGVRLEGSGRQTTRIIGQGNGSVHDVVVNLENGAGLFNLAVENTAENTGSLASALKANAGSVVDLVHVKSIGTGNSWNQGVYLPGIGPAVRLNRLSIEVGGGTNFNEGIFATDTPAILDHVIITVSDTAGISNVGIYADGSPSYAIRQSVIDGPDNSIFANASGTFTASHSQFVGDVTGAATWSCRSVHDDNLVALSDSCMATP